MNIENISRYVYLGRNDKDWYRDCQQTITSIFGQARLKLVADLLAATSINTSLKSNLTLFRRALYEIDNGLPIGRYLPNIQQQLRQIRDGKELTGRKIRSFSRAMQGDQNAVVVDIWILRAFDEDRKTVRRSGPHEGLKRSSGATDKQYTIIEAWIRQEAMYRQLHAAELCSMIWGGIRREIGRDNETRYCDFMKQQLITLFI